MVFSSKGRGGTLGHSKNGGGGDFNFSDTLAALWRARFGCGYGGGTALQILPHW